MSTMKINSDNVKVYPTSSRNDSKDPTARFNTEKNLISLVNRLTGVKSFVVSGITTDLIKTDGTLNTSTSEGVININGYLFELSALDIPTLENNDCVYFQVNMLKDDGPAYNRLKGGDDGKYYTAISLLSGTDITTDETNLVIAKKVDGKWTLPKNIFTPFMAENVYFKETKVENGTEKIVAENNLKDFLLSDLIIDDGEL